MEHELHDVNKLKRPTTVEIDVFFEQFSQGAIWISYNTKRMHVPTTIKKQQEGDRTRESKQEHRSQRLSRIFFFSYSESASIQLIWTGEQIVKPGSETETRHQQQTFEI